MSRILLRRNRDQRSLFDCRLSEHGNTQNLWRRYGLSRMSQALTFGPPVISVDVEDWPQSTWNRDLPITQRAVANTRRLLVVLRESKVRATMFVLGKFAEAFPEVVREIRAEGHEIACHGYAHVEIFKQSRQEFAKDVRRSKDVIEQILGEEIKGYRAPDFSIVH